MARKKTTKAANTTDLAEPQNRTEEFLANIAGLVNTLPEGEFSRLERYLKYIAENGGGGGGGVTSFNTRTGAVVPQSGDYSGFYAPSGYGWGDESETLGSFTTFAAFEAALLAKMKAMPDHSAAYCQFTISSAIDEFSKQGVSTSGLFTCEIQKIQHSLSDEVYGNVLVYLANHRTQHTETVYMYITCLGDTWLPPEYPYPRLLLGEEYRTTERFLGKPVYIEVVDCGAAPSDDYGSTPTTSWGKDVAYGDSSCRGISVCGVCNGGAQTIPTMAQAGAIGVSGSLSIAVANNNYIRICAGADLHESYSSIYAIVKYTKTTD